MTMNSQGRSTTPGEASDMSDIQTVSGSRGLQQRECLLREVRADAGAGAGSGSDVWTGEPKSAVRSASGAGADVGGVAGAGAGADTAVFAAMA